MIYLDNAATSFPKPEHCLRRGLAEYLALGASPGRGGYDAAVEAGRALAAVREALAAFCGAEGYAVCLGQNATDALNTALLGLVPPEGHVVATRLEHNSVLRPLHHLARAGRCSFDLAPFNGSGVVEPAAVAKAMRPDTALVVLNHASNVLGTVQPVADIAALCRRRGVPLLLDASQSAGAVPLRLRDWGVSAAALTGHKALLGPTGIGALVLDPELDAAPSRFGGTGVDSASPVHGGGYPERLEAGTANLLGALMLGRCLEHLRSDQAALAAEAERELHSRLVKGLSDLDGVTVHCPGFGPGRIPVVSFNLAVWAPGDAGMVLDGDYGIALRTGLHCAPLVHRDLGNGEVGSLRASLGPYNSAAHVDALLAAVAEMLGQKH
jgi:selenocysteine lyase/cysteine desulfurase